jgi:hypothetical protein
VSGEPGATVESELYAGPGSLIVMFLVSRRVERRLVEPIAVRVAAILRQTARVDQ